MRKRLYYDKIDKYLVHARLLGPMHVGSGNGKRQDILLHPVAGLPFIQASSITGAMRDYYDKKFGDAEKLFGSINDENEHALIKVTDGLFSHESAGRIEFRPRVKIDPSSGSVSASVIKGSKAVSGHKFDMEYIGTGAEFSFSVYIYGDSDYEKKIDDQIKSTFAALNNGEIVLGGQKSSGCGNVSISHLYHKHFNLRDEDDLDDWIDEDSLDSDKYQDIVGELSGNTDSIYRITVSGRTEGSILVKGYKVDGFGSNAPDSTNIQNNEKEYIIPGSSLKGAIKSRIEYIAGILNLEKNVVDSVFGSLASDENGVTGNARFYDTVIGEKEANDKNEVSHRIHIDKFTGGVMYKALFSEKTAAGEMNIRIDVKDKNHAERSVGLLIMALRDLASGMYNLGGGYHIGQGFVDVDRMEITYGEKTAFIDYKSNRIDDKDGIINDCMSAVRKGE